MLIMITTLLQKLENLLITKRLSYSLLALLSLFYVNNAHSQVSIYQLDQLQITPSFAPLPAPPTSTLLFGTTGNIDNGVSSVALPFTFNFNGGNYNSVNVSMNGFVTFGTAPAPAEVTPISSVVGYSGVISPFGMDLDLVPANATNFNVAHYTIGAVGSRIFKIQWNMKRSNNSGAAVDSGSGNNTTFQLWLYETTNVIEMHYAANSTVSTFNAYAQIGLRGASNADYKNLNYSLGTADWPGVAPAPVGTMPLGTANNQTVLLRNTSRILGTSNRLFRFTPVTCFAPTGLNITAGSITNSTATLNWSAASPAPANGYDYYVTTSAVAPNAGTTPTGSVGAGVLTAGLTGLTPGALHYVYVRSKCSGVDISSWSTVLTFTTLCNAVNVPYYQPFDTGVGVNAVAPYHTNLPTCTTQQNVGLGNPWVTSNQDLYYTNASMDGNILMYNGQNPGNANPANVWFYTEGINLVAGTTYAVNYLYGGTSTPSSVQNKMRVAYGNYPDVANMTVVLDDHPDIKSSSFSNIVTFTAPSTGVFYFGFQAYSNPNNGQLYVDDIQVYVSSCLRPTNVSVSSISATTAFLNWLAPTPAPGSGYAYYVSTSSTPPTNSTVPTGFTATGVNSVNLSGLTGSTNYYFWVRGNCGFGEFGEWVALDNAGNGYFTTLVPPPSYCIPSGNSFPQDPNGITNVLMGSINNTTGIEPNNYGDYTNLVTNVAQGATVQCNITYATGFTYDTNIWVDWNGDGDFADLTESVYTGVSTNAIPTTLNASFVVPGGQPLGPVRLRIGGIDFGPFSDPCRNGNYQAFEDYTINVIVAPPAIGINLATSIQCASTNSPLITLTTPLANFNTYSWSPSSGVSGDAVSGWTISSNTTTTYILTGTQTVAPFSTNTVSFNYVANQLPTPITINSPSGTVVCPGSPLPLVASGGIVSGFTILEEGFNSGAAGWTTTNTSTGGSNPAAPAWTIRPTGYNPAGSSGITSVVSNDNSSFYMSNADAQGSGGNTNVELISPVFSLAGYTSAALSFYHYVKFFNPTNNPFARVLISTDGGTTYPTTLQQWLGTTLGQVSPTGATPTSFANTVIDLTAYAGQTNLRIKFAYHDVWGYIWAIDNFKISGSASSSVTWTPTTGLFTDPAGTVAYTGTGVSTVYANPALATTYTASASTPSPVCTTLTTVAITVASINGGSASSNQTVCDGIASDLTLSGYSGTITGWQSADNLAFTVGLTNIPASASATLTSAQMGTISATKYFRAVITNGSCTVYSTVVTISLDSTSYIAGAWNNGTPDATKTAIFEDDYSSTGNLSACSVIINNGDVVFNSGHTLTVQNAVNNVGGTLTFNDDSSLVQINDVVNSGNITYTRITPDVRVYDFTYWSSPVSPQTLSALSPGTLPDKYFVFNSTINNWQTIASSNLMVPGTGYIIRAPQSFSPTVPAPFTGNFFGVPNNGTISTNITVGPGTINLIGNPYPSAINADLFLSDPSNDSVIGGTIYLWTHNTAITANQYSVADFALYTYSGGIGTGTAAPGVNNTVPNGKIAAGQSFMIHGSIPASTNPVYFRNSMRVAGNNNQFFRLGSEDRTSSNSIFNLEKHRVWLEVFDNQGAYKQVLVGYIQNATNGLDRGFDGEVFETGNQVFLYTKVDNTKLGIQGRALPFDVNDIVPLGFKSTTTGNYQFRLSDFDGLFDEQDVYLEDTYLNVIHDLKSGDYSFTTMAGTFEDRFVLRYTNSTLGNSSLNFNEDSVFIYKENKDIVVDASNVMIDSVTIYDVRGSQLFSESKINSTDYVVSNLSSSEQVLIVTVTSLDGKKVTKKIVY